MSRTLYSNTDIIVLAYDQTFQASFEHLQQWYLEVERYAKNPKVFVALCSTKSDLPQHVAAAEAQEFANQKGIPFIETSSLHNTGIDDLLQIIIKGAGER
eukprot:gene7712-9033_t